MAITKIKPVKSTLKKALDYIMNPDKTDGKLLVSSYGCSYETADLEFGFTLSQAIEKGNNLAHHLIQSFSPAECADGHITPELAHEIGKRLANEVTKGKYEYVISTHIDRGHIHNHIIFCAADIVNHRKYISNRKTYAHIRSINDSLCREYGLSVVEPQQQTAKGYYEYQADKMGISWKKKLRCNIDLLIPQISSLDELLSKLQSSGYEIRYGKYISCRAPEQLRFTRLKTLGQNYTEDMLRDRIQNKQHRPKSVSLIIDLQNCIQAQQSAGFEHWAKIHNIKQAAMTLNFLTENHFEQYSDFLDQYRMIEKQRDNVIADIKNCENELSMLAVLIKHVTIYHQTRAVYLQYTRTKNKADFRAKHEKDIILYRTAKQCLQESNALSPLPDIKDLHARYQEWNQRKNDLYAQYESVKKQVREYHTVQRNIDLILHPIEKTQINMDIPSI